MSGNSKCATFYPSLTFYPLPFSGQLLRATPAPTWIPLLFFSYPVYFRSHPDLLGAIDGHPRSILLSLSFPLSISPCLSVTSLWQGSHSSYTADSDVSRVENSIQSRPTRHAVRVVVILTSYSSLKSLPFFFLLKSSAYQLTSPNFLIITVKWRV